MSVRVRGVEELLRKLAPEMISDPLRRFWERSAITVQGAARMGAPADRGHLRNTILYQVDAGEMPLWARVGFLNARQGSALWHKARAMEYGTGRVGDPVVSHRASHTPPGGALDLWARRHNITGGGWAVARAIAKRGGLRPRPFLRPALAASMGAIRGFVAQLGNEILEAWRR